MKKILIALFLTYKIIISSDSTSPLIKSTLDNNVNTESILLSSLPFLRPIAPIQSYSQMVKFCQFCKFSSCFQKINKNKKKNMND